MNDDRVESLLRGYRLPAAPPSLDQRVLPQAELILERARTQRAAVGLAREVANALGFGYVNYVIDLVTETDAEYRVEFI
jgi:hypothetical protein